ALIALIILLGLVCFSAFLWLVWPSWRRIQILTTSDERHTAELYRLYNYIDVNLKVVLDGKKVFVSPDFAPDSSKAFREFITWDESGTNLILSVADSVVFAYDTANS